MVSEGGTRADSMLTSSIRWFSCPELTNGLPHDFDQSEEPKQGVHVSELITAHPKNGTIVAILEPNRQARSWKG